jgi:hypothetical protein
VLNGRGGLALRRRLPESPAIDPGLDDDPDLPGHQIDSLNVHDALGDHCNRDRHRVREPDWPRATRVYGRPSRDPQDFRSMAMTEDDQVAAEPCQHRFSRGTPDLVTVHQGDRASTQFQPRYLWKARAQGHSVRISPDGGDRRDRGKFNQDVVVTDVAGVEDVIDPFQNGEDLWTQQAMRIRDQAYPYGGGTAARFRVSGHRH